MEEDIIWWIVQFSVNFLDFVMVYVIMHAMLKRRIKFNVRHVALAVLYTAIVAPIGYFDNYIARIFTIVGLFLVVKFIGKLKYERSLLIYGLSWVLVIMAQLPASAIVWLLQFWIDFHLYFAFLIGQLSAMGAIVLVCKKFKLHQWFHALQVKSVLKLILFIASLVLSVVIFILNFEYQVSYLLFFTLVIISIGLILFPILVKFYHDAIEVISVHDLRNSLLSTGINMKLMNAPEEVYNAFAEHSKELGMDLSQLEMRKVKGDLAQMELMNQAVEQFIQTKMTDRKRDTQILLDVSYFEAHDVIDLGLALKWLGTLLDNALDASFNNPIHIYLLSMAEQFTLKVANEYIGEKGQDIKVIFDRGYSTKDKGRGIGLHHLYSKVTELGGEIEVDEIYNEVYNCHYLQITIKFKSGFINY